MLTNAVTQSDDADVDTIAATAKRRPLPVFIGGGVVAALAIMIVLIAVLRGGSDDSAKQKRVSANEPQTKSSDVRLPDTADSRRAQDGFGSGSQMRIEEERARKAAAAAAGTKSGSNAATTTATVAVTEPPTETAPTETPPTPPPVAAPPPAPVKRTPTLGGKKVVLEYDNTAPKELPKKTVPAKGDDSASIGAARITYFNGNRKLFSGDADAAIKLYKQALAVYPGYVASYRGLGLAYAQKGDKANALKAFRTYIAAVPGAKDIALVRKRIAQLQK
ncbi:MAG: tetratricopeptide repeat protein [Myxococcota bacterium]|nr:tetratricopeptide repeat protein [Myxococcota bacterium]